MPSRRSSRRRQSLSLPGNPPSIRILRRQGKRFSRSKGNIYASTRRRSSSSLRSSTKRRRAASSSPSSRRKPMTSRLRKVRGVSAFLRRMKKP